MGVKFNQKKLVSTALVTALLSCSSSRSGGMPSFAPAPSSPNSSPPPLVFSIPSVPPTPDAISQEYEKCYGVAGEDENVCSYASFDGEPNECAGTAKACDPAAWRWVPKGSCTNIVVGTAADGTIVKGTLEPEMRSKPVACFPYDPRGLKSKKYGIK